MKQENLLIIGSGGYIDAVVLPVITEYFPHLNISILSRRPHRTKTFATQNNLKEIYNLDELKNFDNYFLAACPLDYTKYFSYFKENSNLWLEKPLSELNLEEHLLLKSKITKFKTVRVGFNKRYLIQNLQQPIKFPAQGKISFFIEHSEEISKTLWKDYLIKGGVYWSDGVHALDLALFALGEDSEIKFSEYSPEKIHATINHPTKGEIEVIIGKNQINQIQINDFLTSEFMSNESSRELFRKNFQAFLNNESNIQQCLSFNEKCINAYQDYKNL